MVTATSTLTDDAQRELNRYLRRVRAALLGHGSADAQEIERDIRGHIDAELAGAAGPINGGALRLVLDRLGSPSQWIPAEELPGWRRVLLRLTSGPEDWRLTYATFVLFVGGLLLGGSTGGVLVLASIPLSRAALALIEAEDESPAARRWLLYPPLVFAYAVLAGALLLGPPALVAAVGDPSFRNDVGVWLPQPFWAAVVFTVIGAAGAWWAVLGTVLARWDHATRSIFFPLANGFVSAHGRRLAAIGLVTAALGAIGLVVLIARS